MITKAKLHNRHKQEDVTISTHCTAFPHAMTIPTFILSQLEYDHVCKNQMTIYFQPVFISLSGLKSLTLKLLPLTQFILFQISNNCHTVKFEP